MKLRDDSEVSAWLEKADRDLQMAAMAADADSPLWDQACFHSQQAAEKSLKALFVALDRSVPRTHDLVRLVDSISNEFPELDGFAESAALLTQHGVAPRYPSFLAPETGDDARDALGAARYLMDLVMRLLSP